MVDGAARGRERGELAEPGPAPSPPFHLRPAVINQRGVKEPRRSDRESLIPEVSTHEDTSPPRRGTEEERDDSQLHRVIH